MDAYEAVIKKKDVRSFSEEPVSEESLRRILQAGRMAGSSKASEPCRFVVVKDPEVKKKLAESGAFAGWIQNVPVAIAVVLTTGGGFDGGRAAQNMMIVAHAEGLGSCPVSVQEGSKEVLGLPDGHAVATVLAIGHSTPEAATTGRNKRKRLPLETYVHHDRWRS